MMNTCAVLLSFLLAMVFSITFMEASNGGSFHIKLVHRDSPLSPFYNSSETDFDRSRKSALRSTSRVQRRLLSANDFNTIESQVFPNRADYLMKLSIGTPPVEVLAIADTGSDLIWTQCQPCLSCYIQDLPFFDPKMSSTYRETSCTSSPCQSLVSSALAQCVSNLCEYTYSYGDKSQTNGTLATETFTFDSTDKKQRNVSIPTLAFGCGHSNAGTFSFHGSGLVGLGGGPLSLVSQLGSKIDGKFSYCLVEPFSNSAASTLHFGTQAILSGKKVVSTPLVSKTPDTFYYLTLEAITVDGERLESPKPAEGNIIIDSGTTLTKLPTALYNQFESALRKAIDSVPITDPTGQFKLCYSIESATSHRLPEIVFNFMGGNVSLPIENIALVVSDDLACLGMVPTETDAIYGNLAQVNFLIEYDIVGRKVSFAPTNCTKH